MGVGICSMSRRSLAAFTTIPVLSGGTTLRASGWMVGCTRASGGIACGANVPLAHGTTISSRIHLHRLASQRRWLAHPRPVDVLPALSLFFPLCAALLREYRNCASLIVR